MTTNVPAPTFSPTGFVAPTESAILTGVVEDIQAAFGGNLNLDATVPSTLTTPQGQIASTETAVLGNVNDSFVFMTQMFDPAYAFGRYQDALARIYFIQRIASQPTVLQIFCNGLSGVLIAINALIQDQAGNTYSCTASGTIPGSGGIILPFANLLPGPIAVPASNQVTIYQSIPGWDTVTCQSGVLGNNVEQRAAFETRRGLSVAQNSIGWLPAVRGAVLGVPGVIDAFVTENTSGAAATVGGVSLFANSLYVCVAGGTSAAIAQAIFTRRGPSMQQNGNTTVTVYDTQSGYSPPYPAYTVTYQTALSLEIMFSVVIQNSSLVPANANILIQNAIVAAFAGLDGGTRAKIGVAQLASRYYSTVAALGSWAQIIDILIGSINAPISTFTGSIAGAVLTVTAMGTGSGAIAVGQTIDNALDTIVAGTQILSQTSGTAGGIGVYAVSSSQTLASGTIYGVTASAYKVTVNINQIPVANTANIAVSVL